MQLNSRMLTTSDSLSPHTDDQIVLNDTTGANNTISLPSGTDGLTFIITMASTNTGLWFLSPSGTDVLDATVIYAHGSFTYNSGTWYLNA